MSRSAFSPHHFRRSSLDGKCECRKERNYRLHQPFWWRWAHPFREYKATSKINGKGKR
jgi:hypothetical protein